MGWDVASTNEPIARKTYRCDAADWIINSGLCEGDYDPADWAVIRNAEKENYKILPGTKYINIRGLWDGEWSTFRARIELEVICQKYELYEY